MDEDKPLLEKKDENNTECIGIRTKVVLYVVIFGCAFEISGMAEPQYIYAYLRNDSNYTEANTTTKHVSKECLDNSSTSSDDRIKGLASDWSWYMQLAEAGVALPVLIFAGPLADKIGRKPLLLWNVIISFISFVCKTVIVYRNMNLYFYIIACGILGLSGSFYTFHLANLSLLADATTKGKERSLTLTIYDTLLGIGTVSSQIGTGYLIQLVGFTYPFLITSGLVLALLILICFTLTDTWKQKQEHSELNFQEIPGQVFSLCTNSQNVSRNLRSFLIYFCIYCLYYISLCGMFSLKTIYQLGAPFCWTSEHIGWYGAGTDFVMFITGTIALKCFHTCCLRLKDEIIAICGLVSCAGCFVLFGLSTDDRMLYIGKTSFMLSITTFTVT